MRNDIAKAIVEASKEIELRCEMELYENYAGRGRDTTTGVTYGDQNDLLQAVAVAAATLQRKEFEPFNENEEEKPGERPLTVDAFVAGLSRLSYDSMGKERIAY